MTNDKYINYIDVYLVQNQIQNSLLMDLSRNTRD